MKKIVSGLSVLAMAILLNACGGFVYTDVGGKVTGLREGSTVILLNDDNNYNYTTKVSKDGEFSFRVPSNAVYNITVSVQPNLVNCTVTNGSGRMNGEKPINNVMVNCVPNVQLKGNLTGLDAAKSLYLSVNDVREDSAVSANGAFTFQKYAVNGQAYKVGIATPPLAQICNVSNGSGTANLADAASMPVVQINCQAGVPITGTLVGLKVGTGIELSNSRNGVVVTDTSYLRADGTITFPFSLADGDTYAVQVKTQPVGQKCAVTNGTGVAKFNTTAPFTVTCVAG